MKLLDDFARRISKTFGEAGRAWLGELPTIVDATARRWGLTLGAPFALSYNYVAPVERDDGARFVLKLSAPRDDLIAEVAATRAYAGEGCARLVAFDDELHALLLERLEPGTMLADADELGDERKTEIAAAILQRLWREPPRDVPLPTLDDWALALKGLRARHGGATGPLPRGLFERAERVFAGAMATGEAPRLLHGDLHHENILRAQREPWLAIDPHGVVGDRGYETGTFLRNHLLYLTDPKHALERRVDVFVERLGLERERVIEWGIATNVLSAAWSEESHGDGWQGAIAVAAMLAEMG